MNREVMENLSMTTRQTICKMHSDALPATTRLFAFSAFLGFDL